MNSKQILFTCNTARETCEKFTLKFAKQGIMLLVAGKHPGWNLFSQAFAANTKKEFIQALDAIAEGLK